MHFNYIRSQQFSIRCYGMNDLIEMKSHVYSFTPVTWLSSTHVSKQIEIAWHINHSKVFFHYFAIFLNWMKDKQKAKLIIAGTTEYFYKI